MPISKHARNLKSMPEGCLALHLGIDWTPPSEGDSTAFPCNVGIELEAERVTVSRTSQLGDGWDIVRDGSLRNGLEFVSRGPRSGKDLDQDLENLESFLSGRNPRLSSRTSTHIHIDVCDLNESQLLNFLACCVVFEKALFNITGGRSDNTFCTPLNSSNESLFILSDYFKDPRFQRLRTDNKYSSISLKRILDLGTIEFRSFRPMLRVAEYHKVLHFLTRMKQFALELNDPQDLIRLKRSNDILRVFRVCFPSGFESLAVASDIDEGLSLLNDLLLSAQVEKIKREKTEGLRENIRSLQNSLNESERGLFPVEDREDSLTPTTADRLESYLERWASSRQARLHSLDEPPRRPDSEPSPSHVDLSDIQRGMSFDYHEGLNMTVYSFGGSSLAEGGRPSSHDREEVARRLQRSIDTTNTRILF